MQIRRPELLPALYASTRLYELLQRHPEAGEFYCELYRRDLTTQIQSIAHIVTLGDIDAPGLTAQVETLERRLQRLAAPSKNWN